MSVRHWLARLIVLAAIGFVIMHYAATPGGNSVPAVSVPLRSSSGDAHSSATWDALPLYLAPDMPFRSHGRHPFLVVVGVLTIDNANCFKRREAYRRSWMTYRDVWSDDRPSGSMLVKFLVGRLETNGFQFSNGMRQEAQHPRGDIVAVTIKEYAPGHGGKKDSSDYGLWGGLVNDKVIAMKSFLWRRIAVMRYETAFVAKADDDVFNVVPQYMATLAALPRTGVSWGLHAQMRRDPSDPNTTFPYVFGPMVTHSVDLARIVATDPVVAFVLGPYSGRPSDYMIPKVDREDYAVGSVLFGSGVKTTIFHDCRFVEPFFHARGYPLNIRTMKNLCTPNLVNFHKLNTSLFARTLAMYPDGKRRVAPRFDDAVPPYYAAQYRWRNVAKEVCKPVNVAFDHHERWPELGPLREITGDHTVVALTRIKAGSMDGVPPYLARKTPYQDLREMGSILVLLGVLSEDSAEGAAQRRAVREACFRMGEAWSFANKTNAVAIRFVLQTMDAAHGAASKPARVEALLHGDIAALQRQPLFHNWTSVTPPSAVQRRRRLMLMLMWFSAAVHIAKSPFVAVVSGAPRFSVASFASMLGAVADARPSGSSGMLLGGAADVDLQVVVVSRTIAVEFDAVFDSGRVPKQQRHNTRRSAARRTIQALVEGVEGTVGPALLAQIIEAAWMSGDVAVDNNGKKMVPPLDFVCLCKLFQAARDSTISEQFTCRNSGRGGPSGDEATLPLPTVRERLQRPLGPSQGMHALWNRFALDSSCLDC